MVTCCRLNVCKKPAGIAGNVPKPGRILPTWQMDFHRKNDVGRWHTFSIGQFDTNIQMYMDKEKFYKTVYKLIEDYFSSFNKKPHYLLINSQFDLTKFIDPEDLQQYVNDRFKGMMIVRTPDIGNDKLMVY